MKAIFTLIILLSLTTIIAENPLSVDLVAGQNNLTVEEYFQPIYASELMEKHPTITAISTVEYGKSFGYISWMGGIGTNLIIESGKTYEIHTEENITIILKG